MATMRASSAKVFIYINEKRVSILDVTTKHSDSLLGAYELKIQKDVKAKIQRALRRRHEVDSGVK